MKDSNYSFIFVDNKKSMSKKDRKSIQRRNMFEKYLKIVPFPHFLEQEDVKSPNIILLNRLKGLSGTVKVLNRWKYKNLFPKNYKKKELTLGFSDSVMPNLENSLNSNRIFPKLGLTSINPKKLYELFTPLERPLTSFGEIFDFTWNFEIKQCVPGKISQELKNALGIKGRGPPPWLFKMQELGPPPGWPGVLYPGVNTDIPKGCVYGYEPNGWGKAPKGLVIKEQDTIINNQYTSLTYLEDSESKKIEIEMNQDSKDEEHVTPSNDDNKKRKSNLKEKLRKKYKL